MGKADSAADILGKAADLFPETAELSFFRAVALAHQGQYQDARQILNTCLSGGFDAHRVIAMRAQVCFQLGQLAHASKDYLELDRIGALQPQHRLGIALCLARVSRWKDALRILDEARADGARGELYDLLSHRCLTRLGRGRAAAEVLSVGLRQNPRSTRLLRAACQSDLPMDSLLKSLVFRERLLDHAQKQQQKNPHDGRLAHRIAVLAAGTAALEADSGEFERSDKLLKTAICQWVRLSQDHVWQRRFIRSRARDYGYEVDETADPEALRSSIVRMLAEVIEKQSSSQSIRTVPSVSDVYLRERIGCERLCAALPHAGLRTDYGHTVIGGPLLIRQLHLTSEFCGQVEEAKDDTTQSWMAFDDPVVTDEPVKSLRWLYSSAGFALSRLFVDNPEAALKNLKWCVCGACRRSEERGSVCSGKCPSFESRNPGFLNLSDPAKALLEAHDTIRLHAHVMTVVQLLSVSPIRHDPIRRHLKDVLNLADGQRREAAVDRIRSRLEARIRGYESKKEFELAIDLLESFEFLPKETLDLSDRLAKLLVSGGVAVANAGDLEAASHMLSRAVELQPDMQRAHSNLVPVLQGLADSALSDQDGERAVKLLLQARASESHIVPEDEHGSSRGTMFLLMRASRLAGTQDYENAQFESSFHHFARGVALADELLTSDGREEDLVQFAISCCRSAQVVCATAADATGQSDPWAQRRAEFADREEELE